jgi:hypothetical protein
MAGFFPLKRRNISTTPGLLIGIYLFYENWSIETFRKRDSQEWAGCNTNVAPSVILEGEGYGLKASD